MQLSDLGINLKISSCSKLRYCILSHSWWDICTLLQNQHCSNVREVTSYAIMMKWECMYVCMYVCMCVCGAMNATAHFLLWLCF